MDSSRFYLPSLLGTSCPSWEPDRCMQTADTLMDKCVNHYQKTISAGATHLHRTGTLYAGSLGPLVFLRYRMAKSLLHSDGKKAKELLREAFDVAESGGSRLNPRVSLLESSWVGARVLQCAILHHLNKRTEAHECVQNLLQQLEDACRNLGPSECEVLYGRAGVLDAILFLRQELHDKTIGSALASTLACDIVREGLACSLRASCSLPLLWEWHGKTYLGAVHGVVGILHTLLSLQPDELSFVNHKLNVDIYVLFRQTIDALDELCFPSGNLQSSIGPHPRDKLVHWCHGATGHVMLLAKASTVLNNAAYLSRAQAIATNVLMQRGLLRKGVGLCHGISGNAYALLSMGRLTRNPLWVQRAQEFALFAITHFNELEMVPDHPYSLYEGCAGLAVLLLDLCNPEQSAFPLYEFV